MYGLQSVTYEQQRAEYFREQIAHWERCLNYWCKEERYKKHGWMEIEDRCSDCGARINFYQDALRALGEEPGDQITV